MPNLKRKGTKGASGYVKKNKKKRFSGNQFSIETIVMDASNGENPEYKKYRSAISLDLKLKILKRFDEGDRPYEIAKSFGLTQSTIRSIRRNKEKIEACARNGTSSSATRIDIDVTACIAAYNQQQKPVNVETIQTQATRIYHELKQNGDTLHTMNDGDKRCNKDYVQNTNVRNDEPPTNSSGATAGNIGIFPSFQNLSEVRSFAALNCQDIEDIVKEEMSIQNIKTEPYEDPLQSEEDHSMSHNENYDQNEEPEPNLPLLEHHIIKEEHDTFEQEEMPSPSASMHSNTQSSVPSTKKRKTDNETNSYFTNNEDSCEDKEGDECDVVGKNIAIKLRKLPKESRIFAEKLINDVLFHAQLGDLSRSTFLSV